MRSPLLPPGKSVACHFLQRRQNRLRAGRAYLPDIGPLKMRLRLTRLPRSGKYARPTRPSTLAMTVVRHCRNILIRINSLGREGRAPRLRAPTI
jgi:hypothetical protein